jgi:hypothetical protein
MERFFIVASFLALLAPFPVVESSPHSLSKIFRRVKSKDPQPHKEDGDYWFVSFPANGDKDTTWASLREATKDTANIVKLNPPAFKAS